MIPRIDPDVKYIGSSKLRELTATELRALTGAIVVTGANATPLVVIVPYETYLHLQQAVRNGETVIKAGFVGRQEDIDIQLTRERERKSRRKRELSRRERI